MKIGAERNKLIVLAVVVGILVITVYVQFFASSTPVATPRPAPAAPQQTAAGRGNVRASAPAKAAPAARGQRFQPKFAGESEDLDPMTVDPTLRTDLLAKVRNVEFAGVQRNIFLFGERKKVVPPPEPKIVAKAQERLETLSKPAAPVTPPAPVKPAAPPIQFKYYGFANQPGDARKRAFLLDGEDILIGGEGDVIKSRYKIIRIGVNSIVVEDMQYGSQQTLRLQEQG
jgi:hypothetical protein